MFDCYYCLKSFFLLENFGKTLVKFIFVLLKIAQESMKDSYVLNFFFFQSNNLSHFNVTRLL